MTEDEIDFMRATILRPDRESQIWKDAFLEYNRAHPVSPLHMNCTACFVKVYKYHDYQKTAHS
jgi:hypothetical protein